MLVYVQHVSGPGHRVKIMVDGISRNAADLTDPYATSNLVSWLLAQGYLTRPGHGVILALELVAETPAATRMRLARTHPMMDPTGLWRAS